MVSTPRAQTLETGLVVAGHGRHVWVETASGSKVLCHPRGKKAQALVGDRVLWQASSDEGTIEQVLPRRNLLYRQDEIRTKSFAANLDQIVLLIAAQPEFSERQLARALIAARAENIQPIIALNKSDLTVPFAHAWERLAVYRNMGYTVLSLAIKPNIEDDAPTQSRTAQAIAEQPIPHTPHPPPSGMAALEQLLAGKTTLVLGPSGAGKSSLINHLLPHANVTTNDISLALQSGKHTTTSTSLYWIDAAKTSAIIDSPGFQEFGLQHIKPTDLAHLMPDIHAHADHCKFYNCTHLHEPGCGVLAALHIAALPNKTSAEGDAAGAIDPHRYKIYCELFTELSQRMY